MFQKAVVALALLAAVNAESPAELRRRLSYEKIAGYAPGSQVTDHCAIDLDQAAIEDQLSKQTDQSFGYALQIYNQGGYSKSYAQVTLDSPLDVNVAKGASIKAFTANGVEVKAKALDKADAGDVTIKVQYATTDVQSSYVNCQVGGLIANSTYAPNLDGCLAETGELEINGAKIQYTYNAATDNNNARTIAGFSTGARSKMLEGCPGCPYEDYKYFYDYYGQVDYANQWVTAAINGGKTSFDNGNADFSKYGFQGREQCAKKGTAYMNIFMYVIREFEDAIDDCKKGCTTCNDDSVHAWDEGVCFYAGSLEGQDGVPTGKLIHQLADKRCADFKTCGPNGNEKSGVAKVNSELFALFNEGNGHLKSGDCPAAEAIVSQITKLLYIPLIQGTLRYAYKVDALGEGEKSKAEGAVFAAAVLPRVHAESPSAASTIYENMAVGASSTSYADVKEAFESVYGDIGISCADIGGLLDEGGEGYYAGMEPCTFSGSSAASSTVVFGMAIAAVGAFFGLM